jgi:hypothetical protein
VYVISAIPYPMAVLSDVLYFMPQPVSFTTLNVAGVPINVASSPITADVEATLQSLARATFTNVWTSAKTVNVLFSAKPNAAPGDIVGLPVNLRWSNTTSSWNCNFNSSMGIGALWRAGRAPGLVYVYFNVADTIGNWWDVSEISLMPYVVLHVVDTIAPVANIDQIESVAVQTLDPDTPYELRVTSVVEPGASFVRQVVMYMSSTRPATNTLAAWQNAAGVQVLRFSLISSVDGEWMAVLPPQAPSAQLYWAVYVQDYAGNDNAAGLTTSTDPTDKFVYAADPTAALEEPIGYALIGVMAFGLIFAISYRIQQGVQSVKKAKKVSAAVKKAAPGKTIGGTSTTKTPISKDIPTKSCPICKARIGVDLAECPYCHKKF